MQAGSGAWLGQDYSQRVESQAEHRSQGNAAEGFFQGSCGRRASPPPGSSKSKASLGWLVVEAVLIRTPLQ